MDSTIFQYSQKSLKTFNTLFLRYFSERVIRGVQLDVRKDAVGHIAFLLELTLHGPEIIKNPTPAGTGSDLIINKFFKQRK